MVDATFSFYYHSDSDVFITSTDFIEDTDVIYPISLSQGQRSYSPERPYIADRGEMTFYLDNSSSDLPWTDTNTSYALFNMTGLGAYYSFVITSPSTAYNTLFLGSVVEWNAEPGLFEERTTQIVLQDAFGDAADYPAEGIGVEFSQYPSTLVLNAFNQLPYVMTAYSPSFGEDTLPIAWFDIRNGETRILAAASKVLKSSLGHQYVYTADTNPGFQKRYYRTHDDWIDLGTDVMTFDNQWISIDIAKRSEMQYGPIYVTYHPAYIGDTDVVLYEFTNIFPIIKPGGTWEKIVNYRDPANMSSFISAADTDIVTPASGTDYVVTGVTSTDLSITFTNLGSAGKYSITNNGGTNASFTTLQVRGTPVYKYDALTVSDTTANIGANVLNVDLPYIADGDFAESVLNFLSMTYNRYPPKNIVKSITFQASADSDTLEAAITSRFGDYVHIIEDVNGIDDDYRIIGWDWNIYSCNNIQVTYYVYPNDYTSLHMLDSDASYMTDSNGEQFAFWR